MALKISGKKNENLPERLGLVSCGSFGRQWSGSEKFDGFHPLNHKHHMVHTMGTQTLHF